MPEHRGQPPVAAQPALAPFRRNEAWIAKKGSIAAKQAECLSGVDPDNLLTHSDLDKGVELTMKLLKTFMELKTGGPLSEVQLNEARTLAREIDISVLDLSLTFMTTTAEERNEAAELLADLLPRVKWGHGVWQAYEYMRFAHKEVHRKWCDAATVAGSFLSGMDSLSHTSLDDPRRGRPGQSLLSASPLALSLTLTHTLPDSTSEPCFLPLALDFEGAHALCERRRVTRPHRQLLARDHHRRHLACQVAWPCPPARRS